MHEEEWTVDSSMILVTMEDAAQQQGYHQKPLLQPAVLTELCQRRTIVVCLMRVPHLYGMSRPRCKLDGLHRWQLTTTWTDTRCPEIADRPACPGTSHKPRGQVFGPCIGYSPVNKCYVSNEWESHDSEVCPERTEQQVKAHRIRHLCTVQVQEWQAPGTCCEGACRFQAWLQLHPTLTFD